MADRNGDDQFDASSVPVVTISPAPSGGPSIAPRVRAWRSMKPSISPVISWRLPSPGVNESGRRGLPNTRRPCPHPCWRRGAMVILLRRTTAFSETGSGLTIDASSANCTPSEESGHGSNLGISELKDSHGRQSRQVVIVLRSSAPWRNGSETPRSEFGQSTPFSTAPPPWPN
jgi:hypothetical protein